MRKGEGEGSGRISRLAHTGQHNCVRLNSVSTPRLTASLADDLLSGRASLATPGLLARLRQSASIKLAADQPKYPSLAIAREKWTQQI